MKTTRTSDFPLRWAAPGLVTGLSLLSGVAVADNFPATGQTTCYDKAGPLFFPRPPRAIPCAGTGQDGDIQAGATLRYRDNGNGTITDKNTRLVWEKQSDDDSIHDVGNRYTWDEAFTMHVATLNTICENDETVTCSANVDCAAAGVGGKCGFAGKRDWRLPNVKELQSIINYGRGVVSAAFNTGCVPGATVLTGSCTAGLSGLYWSSTSLASSPSQAWQVPFFVGLQDDVFTDSKRFPFGHVQAVRGGL